MSVQGEYRADGEVGVAVTDVRGLSCVSLGGSGDVVDVAVAAAAAVIPATENVEAAGAGGLDVRTASVALLLPLPQLPAGYREVLVLPAEAAEGSTCHMAAAEAKAEDDVMASTDMTADFAAPALPAENPLYGELVVLVDAADATTDDKVDADGGAPPAAMGRCKSEG